MPCPEAIKPRTNSRTTWRFQPSLALLLLVLQPVCPALGAWGHGASVTGTRRRLQDSAGPSQPDTQLNTSLAEVEDDAATFLFQNATDVPAAAPEAAGSAGQKRPFRLRFYDDPASSDTPEQRSYVMERLMPAAATYLARIIRVRQPTGELPLVGYEDRAGGIIPDLDANSTDGNGSGGNAGTIDGDLVLRVAAGGSAALCQPGVPFGAAPVYSDQTTKRPIFGIAAYCDAQPGSFHYDLEFVLHQLVHLLAMYPDLYGSFQEYARPYDDVVLTTGTGGDVRSWIQTPQVLATVRRHFACPTMPGAPLEDAGGSGLLHWESRTFLGELMAVQVSLSEEGSGQRPLLTDVTLALLQDSNWYDVKYGSASFNSFGYHAGCEFATGTQEEAAAAPSAEAYQCTDSQSRSTQCTHDGSAVGVCSASAVWDNLILVSFDSRLGGAALECHSNGTASGQRCIADEGSRGQRCAAMECAPDGVLLVEGVPCGPDMDCPDDDMMCGDPGHLTCMDTLNDCSGHGDCLNGHCFCHIGWGGDDCSASICLLQCDDGSPCPASGFCGVPECGEWSKGNDSRGVPCNAAAYTDPPTLNTSAAAPSGAAAAPGPATTLGAWFFDADPPDSQGPGGPDVGVAISGDGGEPPVSIGVPLGPSAPAIGTPVEDSGEERGAPPVDDLFAGAAVRTAWAQRLWVLATAGAVAAVMLR